MPRYNIIFGPYDTCCYLGWCHSPIQCILTAHLIVRIGVPEDGVLNTDLVYNAPSVHSRTKGYHLPS